MSWTQAARVRCVNQHPPRPTGAFVLCWLQQVLRATDNPVIDAAIRLANSLDLPVLVYHGLREDYPYASDRLHRFILAAVRDVAIGCADRGIAFAGHIDRAERREKGLVYRLATDAAAIVMEDQPTFVARTQSERVAAAVDVMALAVDAACLVPSSALDEGIGSTSAFRRRHSTVSEEWLESRDEMPGRPAYSGPLPFAPDRLDTFSEDDLDALIASLAIDHGLAPSDMFRAGREGALERLRRLSDEVLPRYAAVRNDATRTDGASGLSPYLHFGVIGPREVMTVVDAAKAPANAKEKFADELLTWREWFHYQARALKMPERYDRIPGWAIDTLAMHASDPRPELETLDAMLHGETSDEMWNACQKQFLIDGWMHNNLRMYWGKRIIAMTPSPEAAWATACYLNDRLSLDGRDPSTYGNIAQMFGGGAPGREAAIYGRVPTRSDGSTRHRPDGPEWIAAAAARPVSRIDVPVDPPVDPYLTGIPAV
ncbi:deoxyribodipyrimidine photo-lyase [Sphingomonas sp. GB1N7]|uniref:deoxyribodipyrimidine photo-lyase n=1 Tax=Parasphingomonas caseinilytica TaxID=3096158 RepID=UPI002FCCA562